MAGIKIWRRAKTAKSEASKSGQEADLGSGLDSKTIVGVDAGRTVIAAVFQKL